MLQDFMDLFKAHGPEDDYNEAVRVLEARLIKNPEYQLPEGFSKVTI